MGKLWKHVGKVMEKLWTKSWKSNGKVMQSDGMPKLINLCHTQVGKFISGRAR